MPFRAENYYSDSVGLTFEDLAGYSRHTGEDALGLLVSPDFAYWLGARTRVTSYARLGFEYALDRETGLGSDTFVLGADTRTEHFLPLRPERAYPDQDYVTPAVKFGAKSRVGRADAPFHLRGKAMVESEVQIEGESKVTAYTTGRFEIRAVSVTGRLIAKGEIGVTIDSSAVTSPSPTRAASGSITSAALKASAAVSVCPRFSSTSPMRRRAGHRLNRASSTARAAAIASSMRPSERYMTAS
ncbi:hypothetical protein [Breoghania sp.]|uniref:hypothetical protein n=1 Tax=Breoghania sp. TaxID=2065378 RepID=UPI0026362C7F|nr:hypothetical protein [Breoghania sp.]MDJ0930125.1 hypothetical protein [Breoghania sp.]